MEISKSTILRMLDIMDRFNKGENIKNDLSKLLDHEDYRIQFEFYQKHWANIGFTKEDYIEFFMNIRKIEPSNVSSKALRYRIDDLLYIMDNVNHFKEVYNKLDRIDDKAILKALNKAKYGLPDNIDLGDIKLVFAVGVGVTGGFRYKNYTYYDLKVTVENKTIQGIINTIAHEIYHIGYNKVFRNLDKNGMEKYKDSTLVHLLSQEGCAVKYGNNMEGVLTKKIYKNQESTIQHQSYQYYISNFDMIYDTFRNDIRNIRVGKTKNLHELEELFEKNYLNRDVKIDGKIHKFYLRNPLTYYLGADIWGLIHDIYGRETVFELLMNPKHFFEYYNKALLKISREDLCIV